MGEKTQAYPAGNLSAAIVREAGQALVVGDRHDAGHDGNIDALLAAAVDEIEVAVEIVEVLRDATVRAGIDLAFQEGDIGVGRRCVGMDFGIAADLDVDGVAEALADVANQLFRVTHARRRSGPCGDVAAQGDDAIDTHSKVAGDAMLDGRGGIFPPGQVRRRVEPGLAESQDGL